VTALKKECEVYVDAAPPRRDVPGKTVGGKAQLEVVVKYFENQRRLYERENWTGRTKDFGRYDESPRNEGNWLAW